MAGHGTFQVASGNTGMMSHHLTDAELIAASGEMPEKFAAIFDRHHAAIRSFLGRRLPGSISDELASEVFVVAFRRRARYHSEMSDARPWLLGIAANLLRHHRRDERRALKAFAQAGRDPLAPGDEQARDEGASIDPEVAEALASLKAIDREVLFLFAYADLTYEQISIALEIPIGTVRSRLSRARSRLRDRLQAAGVEVNSGDDPPRKEIHERDRFGPVVS